MGGETNLEVVETELASFHHISTSVVFKTKASKTIRIGPGIDFCFYVGTVMKMIIHHHSEFHPSLLGDDGESFFASDGSRIWTQHSVAYFNTL